MILPPAERTQRRRQNNVRFKITDFGLESVYNQAPTIAINESVILDAIKGDDSFVSDPQRPHGLQPSRLLSPWDFPGKEYWSGVPLPSL